MKFFQNHTVFYVYNDATIVIKIMTLLENSGN